MLLGIDIGGTTINLGLVEGNKIVKSITVRSFSHDATKEQTIDYLADSIKKIITPDVTRIGIGVPTIVDAEKGIVYNATNIPSWDVVPIKDMLEARFHIPVSVNNDSNCFTLGAAALVGGKPKVLVGITLGTGLGVGVIYDGKLLTGTRCGVGELGSIPYNGEIVECFCSKQFFVNRGWQGKEASDAADEGDPEAVDLQNEFGAHLGELLAIVMFAYDADVIVLGGGVANSYRHFKDSMMATLAMRYPYKEGLDALRIEVLPDGDVPVLGASLL